MDVEDLGMGKSRRNPPRFLSLGSPVKLTRSPIRTRQAFTAVTMRVLQLLAAGLISGRGYVAVRPCAQIASDGVVPTSVIEKHWPNCAVFFSGESPRQTAVVDANYYGLPIEINVALSFASGLCAFLAMVLHTIGVELYVSPVLTLCQDTQRKTVHATS